MGLVTTKGTIMLPFISTTMRLSVFFLVVLSVGACAKTPADSPRSAKQANTVPSVYTRAEDILTASRHNAITRAVEVCSPAVVGINVTEVREEVYRSPFFFDDPYFERFFGGPQTRTRRYSVKGVGSGFIISSDGYILTNDHVAGNATKIVVTMVDGTKHDATVVGTDKVADVTLLKIDARNLPYLKLANSDSVLVGEWSVAFGNPFGLFTMTAKPTVTVGVISTKGVSFTQPDEQGEDRVYKNMIQTDAAISSGNSGGPLVNANGDVIGINTVIYSTAQSSRGAGSIGIGFAIPINRVKAVVDKLQQDGTIDRNFWTGLKVTPIDEETAEYYGISRTDGVLVMRIAGNSPADRAGIEPGDVITAIDGEPVLTMENLNVAVLDAVAGQKLRFTVDRGGVLKDFLVTLSKPPKQ